MSDLISRQDAIDVCNCAVDLWENCIGQGALIAVKEKIEELPSAERKGKWIWKGEEGDSRFMCSVCCSKEYVPTCNGEPTIWEYCPNCGADMRGEQE